MPLGGLPLAGCLRGFCGKPENSSCAVILKGWTILSCQWWRKHIFPVVLTCEEHGAYEMWAKEDCPTCEASEELEDIEMMLDNIREERYSVGEDWHQEEWERLQERRAALHDFLSLPRAERQGCLT